MKKFLFQLLIFLLPFFLIAYSLDAFLSSRLKKNHVLAAGEFDVWTDIYNGAVNSDIVVYGSSRAWVHVNTPMLSDSLHVSAYNMGMDGQTFWLQYLRHKMLLQYNAKPKLIIFSLDIFMLQKKGEMYNAEQFLPYMRGNERKELEEALLGYEGGYTALDYQLPLIRYYGKSRILLNTLKGMVKPGNAIKRVKGYEGQDKAWNTDFDKAKKTMKSFDVVPDSSLAVLFEQFLKEVKSKDIKVVFVYTPEYIEGQQFVKNRTQIIGLFTKLSKKYDIPFYDYSNSAISYHKEYFYNASHMNKTGSDLFTRELIKQLKQMPPQCLGIKL